MADAYAAAAQTNAALTPNTGSFCMVLAGKHDLKEASIRVGVSLSLAAHLHTTTLSICDIVHARGSLKPASRAKSNFCHREISYNFCHKQ